MKKENLTELLKVRIDPSLMKDLKAAAELDERDFADYIRYTLKKLMKEMKAKDEK